MPTLLCISTAGGGQDPLRVRRLTADLDADCTYHNLDRSQSRWQNARELWSLLTDRSWDLVYLEGTGIGGGLPLILASALRGQRYIVSSGDPVGGFFRTVHGPLAGHVFESYERLLYRYSTGFIGWTPYLTGAALRMGAPQGVTVEGAVDLSIFTPRSDRERRSLKQAYGLNPNHLVCGVVGSLTWTPRQRYCYGLELVGMLPYLQRNDVSVLVVGDGDGLRRLRERVPRAMRDRVVFAGRVPEAEVVDALNAMDIGFITQTLDALGRYRLTTKLPEYLGCGLPVAMSPIPGFYDYAQTAGWALPGYHPSSDDFFRSCAAWLDGLRHEEVALRRKIAPDLAEKYFSYDVVRPKFTAFISSLLPSARSSYAYVD